MNFHQGLMGSAFTGMGLATMLFPCTLIDLSIKKQFLFNPVCGTSDVTPALKLVWQCFGAQATLCGVVILSTKFTRSAYRNFGLAMIPFFVFDFYFWKIGALTTFGAAADAIGNALFTYCCVMGYYKDNTKKSQH